ncbi:serine phosphatase RsbU (regulator of sigma subunit) [Allocatelliglobosispora scoriae]|uniref:Serine phosphatase RsbU (Regulator of sigma subunit) n=1 Tax=Allocatelliglobosispora scoriae TaxID=643052 RepID=A0A841BKE9_9ACTN|nr:fused response regulator/phosphatase [Allocatelliglobosispora scoriae]MBB5867659.1 serine phosphatase RsbU (regulator of sigma subunit) [Allocatelliglobosispora scoriae]
MTWPTPLVEPPPRPTAVAVKRLRLLLVEDDPSDAFLVTELLDEASAAIDVAVANSIAQARTMVADADCVLLDLGLPDAHGLAALEKLLEVCDLPVCVLTGLEDEHLAVAAVGRGAQDYLLKSQVSGLVLARAVRYAVERKRADADAMRLQEAELRHAESARLERGLLPQPLATGASLDIVPFYRAGRDGVLGGDFYDAVQASPGRVHLIVGDVAGHRVDEAALGVELRVAWRALVLAGVPDEKIFGTLEQVLESERRKPEIFATAAMVTIDLEARSATVRLAGHPAPVLITGGTAATVGRSGRPVLGVVSGSPDIHTVIDLTADDWQLLIYTDGLIEGYSGAERLGVKGLCRMLTSPGLPEPAQLPAHLARRAEQLNGGALADDIAMLLVSARVKG